MASNTNQTKGKAKTSELTIVRVFDAPRAAVWKAWTDPKVLKRWWGPKGFTAPFWELDLRVGGKFLYCMRAPDGKDYWGTGVYREIVPREKLVATDSFADKDGSVVPATYYGMKTEMPLEMLVTVTFEDLKGKTRLTLTHVGFPPGPDREGANQGWSESFDKLAEELEG
ncbi:MAG TPA: SRPBCC domain-containing protein [Thermoplasmata archaeon]|nr:SRPBCC domain-containing protein [Thermoplasmata archaeon]